MGDNPLGGLFQTLGETQKETNDRVYADGVEHGQDADWVDKIAHNLDPVDDAYSKGVEYGINHPSSDNDDD